MVRDTATRPALDGVAPGPATGYASEGDESIEYDGSRIWLSRFVDAAADRLPYGPVVAGTVALGWPPLALGGVVLAGLIDTATPAFLASFALTAGLLTAFPVLIWYYDARVLTRFAGRMRERVADEDALADTAATYERRFARRYPMVVVPWTILLLGVVAVSLPTFAAQGIAGVGDPLFWAVAAFFCWGGLLTGIGFHGALTTVGYLRTLVDRTILSIDPYHPDGLGGMSSVGYFAIRTTLLLSTGALLLPFAFQLAAGTPFESPIYLAVALYVGVIAGSFAYPTWLVNRSADEVRVEHLDALGSEITALQQDLAATPGHDVDDVGTLLELQRLQQLYDDYRATRLYPMSPSILSQLVASVLLPIVMLGLESVVLG
ncbi:hypothetical protein [Halovivax limisalsi]|uniref:hypothetical protein n=1 Tax=Halovivax limisalsi TaxID=1453760 RepID=UPI001FFC4E9A|nr:hypothetical protein [Halovivax limisalsi]